MLEGRRRRRPGPAPVPLGEDDRGHAAATALRAAVLGIGAVLLAATCLHAQGGSERAVLLSARVGPNSEGMDPGSGVSAGVGAAIEVSIRRNLGIEVEAWLPAFIDGEVPTRAGIAVPGTPVPPTGRFRTLLLGLNAVRHFGGTRARPYVLAGLAAARTQIRSRDEPWTMGGAYVQAGAGVLIPLSARLSLAPELRLATEFMATSLRPMVAIAYRLR